MTRTQVLGVLEKHRHPLFVPNPQRVEGGNALRLLIADLLALCPCHADAHVLTLEVVIAELKSLLAQAREAIRTLRAADPGLEHYLTIPDALCDAQVIKIKRVLEADAARSPTEPTQ